MKHFCIFAARVLSIDSTKHTISGIKVSYIAISFFELIFSLEILLINKFSTFPSLVKTLNLNCLLANPKVSQSIFLTWHVDLRSNFWLRKRAMVSSSESSSVDMTPAISGFVTFRQLDFMLKLENSDYLKADVISVQTVIKRKDIQCYSAAVGSF
jgi:hypothetical protein